MKEWGRLGGLGAFAVTLVAALPLAGCSSGVDASDSPDEIMSSTPGLSESPSPSPVPAESQSEVDHRPDPVPEGSPVTPDIFMTTVDSEADVLRVVVLVPGIYENDGLCAVTVAGVSATITKESASVADASATVCGEYTFGLEDLGSGTARVSATYKSDGHEGSSATTEVSIP